MSNFNKSSEIFKVDFSKSKHKYEIRKIRNLYVSGEHKYPIYEDGCVVLTNIQNNYPTIKDITDKTENLTTDNYINICGIDIADTDVLFLTDKTENLNADNYINICGIDIVDTDIIAYSTTTYDINGSNPDNYINICGINIEDTLVVNLSEIENDNNESTVQLISITTSKPDITTLNILTLSQEEGNL